MGKHFREVMEWFQPRPGRCNTCQNHMGKLASDGEVDCWCDLEETEKPGWFPGMHLDHCIFPPSAPGASCSAFVMDEALRFLEGG